jgi:thermitase
MKNLKSIRTIFSGVLGLLFFLSLSAQHTASYAPDRIIIKFRDNVKTEISENSRGIIMFNLPDLDALNATYGCASVSELSRGSNSKQFSSIYLLTFKEMVNIPEIIKKYINTGYFIYAEPDYKGFINGMAGNDSIMPNDTWFSRQWSLYNNGTFGFPGVKMDADIDMTEGWTIEQGDSNIIVGIIDTGVKFDHPELSGRIWHNYEETPGNGIDDDNNTYIDDTRGWDFANNDNDPADDEGHGTNVTGIIGANGNNSIGYAGVDWNCKLMILKGINSSNWGYYSWWIGGINYAVNKGADVINMSVGGTDASQALEDAVSSAIQSGVVVVACMMNNNSNVTCYPAACLGVIAVGSTDPDDNRSHPFFWDPNSGSNYGPHISVVAPGNYIYGLDYQSNTNYSTYWGGTSQATPHVAGLASLLRAQNPGKTPAQIKTIIENSAEDQVGEPVEDTPGWDQYYGWGRVNAYAALQTTQSVKEHDLNALMVYPNPSSGQFQVKANLPAGSDAELVISDPMGKILNRKPMNSPVTSFDLSGFEKGVYIITMKCDEGISIKKIILQ